MPRYKKIVIETGKSVIKVKYVAIDKELETSGTLCFIYKVDDYFVLTSPFTGKPWKVLPHPTSLTEFFKEQTGITPEMI